MKLTDFRGILQYIPQFREKTFVIGLDGAVVTGENFSNICMDIAVLRSLSIRVVLVHGASAQIKSLAEEQKITPTNLDGTGITDSDTLQLALTAANRLTHEILEALAANDLRAACTNAIIAHPMGILQGVDHLQTGKVERVDVEFLQTLLDHGIIPVLPPLGVDGDGKTFRVNSDSIAVSVAETLKAAKLMFITKHDGIKVGEHVIRQMPVSDLESVLAMQRARVHPEMLSKAIHAVAACKAGVQRVHVLNGSTEEGLLAEVFTNEGVGTLVYANEFQQIRRALKKDVRAILNLTKSSVASEELLKRTRPMIEKQLGDYYIFEIDKNPVACVALHVHADQGKGELACLYVSPSHENQGIGRKLIQFVENRAREMGLVELQTLSTQAFSYFQSKGGFIEGSPDDLPAHRREKYDQSGRNSKVLVKRLKPPGVG
ncbi:MAG: amino-acid N-acetyltransferase [Verrucomicrobia bacterium]|nr:amino-acid N-acetyltransferase [Verrucomicrobiota bacterium]